MEPKKDEEEGVDAADSIVFVVRVCSFFSALAPRALPPSLAPIRHAHGFLMALQTLGKVPKETLIIFFLYWPRIPQVSLQIWKLQVSHFASAAHFNRTKLGSLNRVDRASQFRLIRSEGVFWFFCRSWSCPIESSFARSTRSGDLVSIGQIY